MIKRQRSKRMPIKTLRSRKNLQTKKIVHLIARKVVPLPRTRAQRLPREMPRRMLAKITSQQPRAIRLLTTTCRRAMESKWTSSASPSRSARATRKLPKPEELEQWIIVFS